MSQNLYGPFAGENLAEQITREIKRPLTGTGAATAPAWRYPQGHDHAAAPPQTLTTQTSSAPQRYPQGHDHAAALLQPPPTTSSTPSTAGATLFGGIDTKTLFKNSEKNKNAAADFAAAKDKLRSLKRSFPKISWIGFYLGRQPDGYTRDMFAFLRGELFGVLPIYWGLQITGKGGPAGIKLLKETPNLFGLGTQLAQKALTQANAVGIPEGFCLFYDFEEPPPLKGQALLDHLKYFRKWQTLYAGWSEAVVQAKFRPGVYIHAGKVKPLLDALQANKQITKDAAKQPRIWAMKYLPGFVNDPGMAKEDTTPAKWVMRDPHNADAGAHLWQWGGNQRIVWQDSITNENFKHEADLNTSFFRDPGSDP
jgi:hypothetical protein